ncbi:ComF family protein [Flexithrix dorotheae]|uniref:ComF family protein n=1 Tax=Flexithrix dorotheae TaxID=70993 RepID=UPI0003821E0E|nr:ComF family protein [Flexithrix dorotheae]
MFSDFLNLIFPSYCLACHKALVKNEDFICTYCRFELPKTEYHLINDNQLSKKFYGKVNIENSWAYLKYAKEGKVQKIIHELKYQGKSEIGEILGKWYGFEIKSSKRKYDFDLIIPIPLHVKKLKKRGYNQTDGFAKGLSESLIVPWDRSSFIRNIPNRTQTKKDKYERWLNVKDIFLVKNPSKIKNKHILLVDDVITTGSTIEAGAYKLLEAGCRKVSVAAIATA